MEIVKINNRRYVVTGMVRSAEAKVPEANFMQTGKALVGLLNENETLEEFESKRLPAIKRNSKKVVENAFYQYKKSNGKKQRKIKYFF